MKDEEAAGSSFILHPSSFTNGSSFSLHPSAFTNALDTVAARQVILFGGKGGVGKTTLSGIAAQHFAASRRVIRFSSDPANEDFRSGELWSKFLGKNLEAFLEIGDRGTYLDREELRRFF